MSKVLEKSLGGFLSSILGSDSSLFNSIESYNAPASTKIISLGLVSFVERLQAARKISKQEEEDILTEEYQEWLRQASHHNAKNELIADYLCRSLIAFSRGHYFTNLHINAIKLTQSEKLLHQKIGYLYISRTMDPGSDLTVLLVNTVQRDISSSHVIQISLGLSLLPIIISLDVSSLISNSLAPCLSHPQAYIRKRAAIMASCLISQNPDTQSCFALLLPNLLQMLSNSEPSVAISSTVTLSNAFKVIHDTSTNESIRNEIAKSCSHILLEATRGHLPQSYNVGPVNAPFVQVQMLRSIQNISTHDWVVPAEVISAVEGVLLQPWGGRNLSLYMALLEAVMTSVCLPRNETLISYSLKIILGFLKSSNIDFKYLGIKALAKVFSTLEDTLTEAHLKAVLECLDSSSQLLQSRTIRLLCSMANKNNYQAICFTLMEFAHKTTASSTREIIFNHLANIVKRISSDIPWCIAFLSSLLESPNTKRNVLESMKAVVMRGTNEMKSEEEMEVGLSSCHKLFGILLNGERVPLDKLTTVAYVLNLLFSIKPESINLDTAKLFIDKVSKVEISFNKCDDIFDCLLSCGLHIPECVTKIKSIYKEYSLNKDLYLCLKAKEKLLLLDESELTTYVNRKRDRILDGNYELDFTLSFYDQWTLESLKSGCFPYKPFTVKTRTFNRTLDRKAGSFNPFDGKPGCQTAAGSAEAEGESLSTSGSLKSSLCGISSNISGASPKDKNVWTSKGRIKQSILDSEGELSPVVTGCVEIAQEAEESFLFEDGKKSAASSYLDSQKVDLTHVILKGLGLSKIKP